MTQPNPEVKEQQYIYQTDQQVSVNAFVDVLVDGEAVKFQVTSRYGSTPEKIFKTTSAAIEAYRMLRQSYPKPEHAPRVSDVAPESGEKKYEPKPVQHEGLPDGMDAFKEDFDEIEITPQPDDKVTVAFYRDGLKFPVGARINKWTIKNVTQALVPIGEFDLTKAAKIRVAGTQYYTNGAEYIVSTGAKKGEKSHYKDLRLIEARF